MAILEVAVTHNIAKINERVSKFFKLQWIDATFKFNVTRKNRLNEEFISFVDCQQKTDHIRILWSFMIFAVKIDLYEDSIKFATAFYNLQRNSRLRMKIRNFPIKFRQKIRQ